MTRGAPLASKIAVDTAGTGPAVAPRSRVVPDAGNLVQFELKGAGKIIGVGNGDPSSHESDKAPFRNLFNGLALAIVQSTQKTGAIIIRARADGLNEATVTIKTRRVVQKPSVP